MRQYNVTTNAYDIVNNLITVTQPHPDTAGLIAQPITHYTYDNIGEATSTTDPENRTSTYAYNSLGQQITATMPDPENTGPLLAPQTSTTYDVLGGMQSQTDRLGHGTTDTYDGLHRLSSQTDSLSGVTAFTYDDDGERLTITDPVSNTTTWGYDILGRVNSETNQLSQGMVRTRAYRLRIALHPFKLSFARRASAVLTRDEAPRHQKVLRFKRNTVSC